MVKFMESKLVNTVYVIGRGTVLVMKGNSKEFKIGDMVFDNYEVRGIEYSQHSSVFGLIVRKISDEKDGNQ